MRSNQGLWKYRKLQARDIVGGMGTGNVYYVLNSSDSFYSQLVADLKVAYSDGTSSVHSTIASAYAATTSGRGDVIILSPNTTHSLTEMLTVSNNRVHFVGWDISGRITGQRAKINMGVTTAVTDVFAIKVTGNGCSFSNIKLSSSNTLAQNLGALGDAGEATMYDNCSFHNLGSAHLTNAACAPVVLAGDGSMFKDCEIGADTLQSTVASGQVILIDGIGSAQAKRCMFDNCNVLAYTNKTTHAFVRVAADGDIDRFVRFKNCSFYNFYTSSNGALMAVAFASASGLTSGIISVEYPAIIGATDLATAAVGNAGMYVIGTTPTAGSDGIAVQPTA